MTTRFITLGGFKVGNHLKFISNQSTDVQSVREFITPSKRGGFSDYDLERHSVPSPSALASGQQFAETLVAQAENYKVNALANPVEYDLANENCSAWANTMFKVAGVPHITRKRAGEFWGIDWGEEDELDASLFQ